MEGVGNRGSHQKAEIGWCGFQKLEQQGRGGEEGLKGMIGV
jgi:hypothetical protein